MKPLKKPNKFSATEMFSKGIYIHFNWALEMRKMHQICHTEGQCLVLVTDFKSLSLKGETVISKEVNNFKSLCQLHRCTFGGVDNCNTMRIQDRYRRILCARLHSL